jgi:hypothetical protein
MTLVVSVKTTALRSNLMVAQRNGIKGLSSGACEEVCLWHVTLYPSSIGITPLGRICPAAFCKAKGAEYESNLFAICLIFFYVEKALLMNRRVALYIH